MGFLEDLAKAVALGAITEMSKDKNGKPDPYKAAGIAAGTGHFSPQEQAMLGAMLGSQGAFDEDDYKANNPTKIRKDNLFDDDEFDDDIDLYDGEKKDKDKADDDYLKYDWRDFCEDGFDYDVDPDDYETEEEYEEALNEEKYGWRDLCENGFEYGLDPDDYETEEEYEEALNEAKYGQIYLNESEFDDDADIDENEGNEEAFEVSDYHSDDEDSNIIKIEDYPTARAYKAAYDKANCEQGFIVFSQDENRKKFIERCDFILNNDSIAAKYLTSEGEFIFTQAVKEHFSLPLDFPDEDAEVKTSFSDMFSHLYNVDKDCAFEAWEWCVNEFMPYCHYSYEGQNELNFCDLSEIDDFGDDFENNLIQYISEHNSFGEKLFSSLTDSSRESGKIITQALKLNAADTAKILLKAIIGNTNLHSVKVLEDINYIIDNCSNYEELETMELFKNELYPLIFQSDIKGAEAYKKCWDERIKKYIDTVEMRCPKYAYSRRYAWRAKYKNSDECLISPENYETEATFLSKVKQRKYEWRKHYIRTNNHGINPNEYETLNEFRDAINKAIEAEREEMKNDKTIYTYCGVMFDSGCSVYHYMTDDDTVKVGDKVVVPIGRGQENSIATVVSVGQYMRIGAPFPVEKTKKIIGKYIKE